MGYLNEYSVFATLLPHLTESSVQKLGVYFGRLQYVVWHTAVCGVTHCSSGVTHCSVWCETVLLQSDNVSELILFELSEQWQPEGDKKL